MVGRRVLGGTKVGNGAWALAWVDTCLDLPGPKDLDPGSIDDIGNLKPHFKVSVPVEASRDVDPADSGPLVDANGSAGTRQIGLAPISVQQA